MLLLSVTYYDYLEVSTFCVIGAFISSTLFFDQKAFKVTLILSNVFQLYTLYLAKLSSLESFTLIVCINITGLSMYFLAKWSNDLLMSASKDAVANKVLLEKLEKMLSTIDMNTLQLNEKISINTTTVSEIRAVNKNLNTLINEISTGTTYQAEKVNDINNMMHNIENSINVALIASTNTNDSSFKAKSIISTALSSVDTLNVSARDMNNIVSSSIEKVTELTNQLSHITSALSNIKDITEQTDLLALNASIEAARAGEVGKGFSIVANEIKNLAQTSSDVSKDIDILLETVSNTIETVLIGVKSMQSGTNNNLLSTESVTNAFNEINSTFNDIDNNAQANLTTISKVNSLYSDVLVTLADISNIATTHSTIADKTLEITKDQTNSLENIITSTNQTKELSESLRSLIQRDSLSN